MNFCCSDHQNETLKFERVSKKYQEMGKNLQIFCTTWKQMLFYLCIFFIIISKYTVIQ